jgi:predicted SAM-dependent methyltransferase
VRMASILKRGINCGSGQRPFTSTPEVEWCNVDSQARWNPDLVCDAARLPFPDGSADYFVLHHVLEHFGCGEGMFLLTEAYRVLKPGGSLLVFVPDLKALAQRWLAGGINEDPSVNTQIYVTCLMGAFMGAEEDRHKWNFDAGSLHEFLSSNPWTFVRQYDWRGVPGMNAARDWWILAQEAVK